MGISTETILALKDAGVDTEGSLHRFGGRMDLYGRFLLKFPEDDSYGRIAPALEKNDYKDALMAAHTLKGVAANLGMNRLASAAANVVTAIRSDQPETSKDYLDELEDAFNQVCAALRLER